MDASGPCDREGLRQLMIEKGRRILRKFCASKEGRRKLERHRASRKRGFGTSGTAEGDCQNTPRAIADWQRSLVSPPRHGCRSETLQEHAVKSPWLAVRSAVLGALAQLEHAVDSADSLHATSTLTTPAKWGSSSGVLGRGASAPSARSDCGRNRSRIAAHEHSDDGIEAGAGMTTCASCRGPNSELSLLKKRLAAQQRDLDHALREASDAEKRAQEEGLEVAMELLEGEIEVAKEETAGWQKEAARWQAAAESESRRAERATAEAERSAAAERSARDQLSEAVSTMGRELSEARDAGERLAKEAMGWWDDWEVAASAVAGAFDSASRRAQAAADAAALEISTLRKMLDKAKEEERRQGPFISPGPKTSATDCGVSQPWPDVDGGGSSEARGQDGRHGSCQPARRTAASASGGGVAREPCASRGEAGTCAGEASARDRLQPPPSDSSPRIGGRYWRRLTAATAERIEDKQAAEQSPPRADHARALSPMLCRGSSPGFSVSFQGRVACFGGKRVPAGCSPWERGGGASARMLAPPDGPERRERAQAGWTK